MSTVHVKPGVCGLESNIQVIKKGRSSVEVKIESTCPYVKKMEDDLQDLDGYNEVFKKFGESAVYQSANEHARHLACPVPTGIIKAIEVECGLALPRDVEIKVSK